MSEFDAASFWGGIVVCIVLVIVPIGFIASYNGASMVRKEAIEAGAAEYRVDPKTVVTEFHWKE